MGYAFEPVPPFKIVAQSGQFCMPCPTEELDGEPTPGLEFIKTRPYRVNFDMNCPFVTFVMGILEAADDPSYVIISYGMNDCGARIVKVDKKEVIKMLFL